MELYLAASASYLETTIRNLLFKFGLNHGNIVSITCDNGANMLKYASLIEVHVMSESTPEDDNNIRNINNQYSNYLEIISCFENPIEIIDDLLNDYDNPSNDENIDSEDYPNPSVQPDNFSWLTNSLESLKVSAPFFINRCGANIFQLAVTDITRVSKKIQKKI